MTEKLVKILEKALELVERSDSWFDYYDESNDENDWEMSQKFRKHAQGLLDAYEILTGKKVNCLVCSIREELETVKKHQDMREFVKDAMDEYEELGIACLL